MQKNSSCFKKKKNPSDLVDAPTIKSNDGYYRTGFCSSVSVPSSALKMASILHKLFHPLFSGPPEPPRNKVTVVGVGQVGMACAVTILLRVRGPRLHLCSD